MRWSFLFHREFLMKFNFKAALGEVVGSGMEQGKHKSGVPYTAIKFRNVQKRT